MTCFASIAPVQKLTASPSACLFASGFVCLLGCGVLFLCVSLSVCLFISVCLSVCLSLHLSLCLSLSLFPSLCLSACLSVYLSICLSLHPSIRLSDFPSVCCGNRRKWLDIKCSQLESLCVGIGLCCFHGFSKINLSKSSEVCQITTIC